MKVEYLVKDGAKNILIAELQDYVNSQDRIALQKQSALDLIAHHYNRPVQFFKDEFGKPFLMDCDEHISISHSKDKIAIMIADRPCGLDLQYLDEKVFRVQHKFLSEAELSNIDKGYSLLMLTLGWSVKEAVYKYYGRKQLNYIRDMQIQPYMWQESGCVDCVLRGEEWIKVAYIYKDEYILAWTL